MVSNFLKRQVLKGKFKTRKEDDGRFFVLIPLDSIRLDFKKIKDRAVSLSVKFIYNKRVVKKFDQEYNVCQGDSFVLDIDKVPYKIYVD